LVTVSEDTGCLVSLFIVVVAQEEEERLLGMRVSLFIDLSLSSFMTMSGHKMICIKFEILSSGTDYTAFLSHGKNEMFLQESSWKTNLRE
jgi:hypothetical protein